MNPALDPESDFQLFDDSVSVFGSSKKRNLSTNRVVMIPGYEPDQNWIFRLLAIQDLDLDQVKVES